MTAAKKQRAALIATLDALSPDAPSVRIIGFVDTGHPALLRMWDKHQRGYRAMGYRVATLGEIGEISVVTKACS